VSITAVETITFEVRVSPDEVIKQGNDLNAQDLRDFYDEARMPYGEGEIQSLAEVFSGEEVREGFRVTDDPEFLPRWKEFADEHGLLLVE
jgi:hypothetical protein